MRGGEPGGRGFGEQKGKDFPLNLSTVDWQYMEAEYEGYQGYTFDCKSKAL